MKMAIEGGQMAYTEVDLPQVPRVGEWVYLSDLTEWVEIWRVCWRPDDSFVPVRLQVTKVELK